MVARAPLASFTVMGAMWGSFAADLPDLKAALDVDEARLGLLLFPTPVAAVLTMFLAPFFARIAGNMALFAATLCMALAFSLPGQATTVWLFPFAMIACGAATGLTDVLMNARVSQIEAARGQSLMNLCHAAYSFGYAGGAVATGALRSAGWPPSHVLAAAGVVAAFGALWSYERQGAVQGLDRPKDQTEARLGLIPLIGGAMVFIAFLTENATESWSALFIEETLGGSPAHGAMGPAVMAITMGVARLFGQSFANRFAPIRLLIVGAVISAVGLLIAASAQVPGAAYAGFIIAGIGASVIAPTAFSMVGGLSAPQARARAVARATMIGYLGYFVGPPGFGFLSGAFGLRATFVLAAILLLTILILAPLMSRRQTSSAEQS
jgi:MFS family permease